MFANASVSLLLASAVKWPIFPENGLDRSLHVPVLIGLLLISFFAETLGWTYAGLVVPGYLASVFVAAPVTGALVVGEAVLTYLLTALVGLWLPRTGAWSSSFGRERFFLFIVSAIVVRLAVEGNLLPWLASRYEFAHSRELYSLGLVLVPLLANAFWNAGLLNAVPRVGFITLVTFACVKWILLPHTNFTVSRFAIANEAVSLAFLESPHAHIILLIGALLGARNNLLYGWDYNGILVPGLLAVAWYQPTKLLTTMVESILIFWIARAITTRGPFKKLLIVGSRRMVVVFLVGFAAKYLIGFCVMRWAPSVQMVDYFGFGYLLPSLLAVKMWNKEKVGTVIMPTLQVSLLGFIVGNVVGFGLSAVDLHFASAAPRAELAPGVGSACALDLMLGDSAPAPRAPATASVAPRPGAVALLAAEELAQGELSEATRRLMIATSLSVSKDPVGAWLTLTPRSTDPDEDQIAPRVALRGPRPARAPWLVIAAQGRAESAIIAASQRVAEWLDARAIVVRSRLPEVAAYDDAFIDELVSRLHIEHVLVVREAARSGLDVAGAVPAGFDLNGLGTSLGVPLGLTFRAAQGEASKRDNAPRLELTADSAEQIGAEALGAPGVEHWPGSVRATLASKRDELTRVGPRGYRGPSIEELRLFGTLLFPALTRLQQGVLPSAWQRAVAARLDYHFVALSGSTAAFMLCELGSAERRGNASFIVTPRAVDSGPAIEVPAPLWERGTLSAGLALFDALDSDLLLVSGAFPNGAAAGNADLRKPSGRRSFYHRAHELWLETGGRVLAVNGIAPERESGEDAVLSFGREVPDAQHIPGWTQPLLGALLDSGLRVGVFDGELKHVAFEGSGDPAFEYARRFGNEQMAIVWLSAPLREHWSSMREDDRTGARLARTQVRFQELDVAARAVQIRSCLGAGAAGAAHCPKKASAKCDPERAQTAIAHYAASQNPYDLLASMPATEGCAVEWLQDGESERLWLLVVGVEQARLIPLQGTKPALSANARLAPQDLHAAVSLGIASIRLEP